MFSCVHYISELRTFPQAKSHLVGSLEPKRSRWFRRIETAGVGGFRSWEQLCFLPPSSGGGGSSFNRSLLEFDVPSVLIRTRHIRGNVKLTDV